MAQPTGTTGHLQVTGSEGGPPGPNKRVKRWKTRLFFLFVLAFVLLMVATMAAVAVIDVDPDNATDLEAATTIAVMGISRAVIAIPLLWLWARYLDHRPLRHYGLRLDRLWVKDVVAGTILAVAIPTAVALVGLSVGWLSFDGTASFSGEFLLVTVLMVVGGLGVVAWEEPLFRGFMLTNAAVGIMNGNPGRTAREAVVRAWFASAFLFAFLHFGLVLAWKTAPYYMIAALTIGIFAVWTGEVGMSLGYHLGYNFGSVFLIPSEPDGPSIFVLSANDSWPAAVQHPWLTLDIVFIVVSAVVGYLWVKSSRGTVRVRELWAVGLPE